jgi:hypothetical protein
MARWRRGADTRGLDRGGLAAPSEFAPSAVFMVRSRLDKRAEVSHRPERRRTDAVATMLHRARRFQDPARRHPAQHRERR